MLAAFWPALVALFSGIGTFLAQYVTKTVAIVVVGIAVIMGITTAFVAGVNGIVDSLITTFPAWVNVGASWFIPTNLDDCLATIFSAHVLRWGYDWQVKVAMMRMGQS